MPKNLGCTGGLYEGIKISRDMNDSEWCWIMDDDTVPFPDALENLVRSAGILGEGISFMKSVEYDADNHFVGIGGGVDTRPDKYGCHSWGERLSEGFLKVMSVSFVSLLVNSKAIEKCGLPCKDYFIWGDDTEYSFRLTKYYGPGYSDGRSRVYHKTVGHMFFFLTEPDSPRLNNYYYAHRNGMVNMIVYHSKKEVIKYVIVNIMRAFRSLAYPPGFKRFRIAMSGMLSGLFTWRKYYKFIQSQIKA